MNPDTDAAPAARILVVEDEDNIRRFVRLALVGEGHEVFEAASLRRGLIEAGTRRPDLLVLDLGLPDGDGVALIRDLRGWSGAPVIVLSARAGETDKIAALDAGADDYLVKPFGAGELLARVRAQLRRQRVAAGGPALHAFGDVRVDAARRSVQRAGQPLHLTPIEYRLLMHLLAQPERVLTHRQLLQSVWGPGHTEDTHYVRVHMANLRKKIEDDPARPRHLLTETGIGYRFAP
ncbi:two-component system, OmpR family, KDP operon response regulator KdpE [Oryzisolibacter propanilivorax]|uniref:Two-component system, OmpR family, KDP operon response regulator KdpE n=1 Tax=Oryzisolibacter propanilivorax TaxID=1527607 RepID=A0A1G9NZZ8_9BURK|nr:two-component system response regulator KdpE [Oryzisolibacter propanilivorax]SDL91954.1 two-component system, OmpR family, KDP operon response regulator KdpE [Oryzisolibacter propanilivorax]